VPSRDHGECRPVAYATSPAAQAGLVRFCRAAPVEWGGLAPDPDRTVNGRIVIALALAFLAGAAGDWLTAGRWGAPPAETGGTCRSCPLLPVGEQPRTCGSSSLFQ